MKVNSHRKGSNLLNIWTDAAMNVQGNQYVCMLWSWFSCTRHSSTAAKTVEGYKALLPHFTQQK